MERSADCGNTPVSAALDALATRMGLGLLLLDSNGRHAFSNRTVLDLLGCRDGDAVARRWAELQSVMEPQGGAPMSESASRAFTADLPLEGATRFLRGEIRPAVGGSEVFLKDRRSLGELDIELLFASSMREWIHQCEALVHDANGALNTIQLTLELLDGEWSGQSASEQIREPYRRNHVNVVRDNLEKLKSTLRQLVSAHDAAAASAVFDLRDVVKEAAFTLRMPSRRRRIDLRSQIADRALPVNGNRVRIRQALVNVALCRVQDLAERSGLTLEANASGEGFEIVCRDEGPLAEAGRAGIFRVLFAESGAGSGTDALRLARAIVESEAGEFLVRNDTRPGTAFRFLFPQAAD